MSDYPVRSITRDGVKLAYLDAGSGGPPLVFVHGWSGNHTYWRRQVPHFAQRHRVVAVDLRGCGESDAPEGEYTMAAFADDIAWLIEALSLERPIVVGHSMGGTLTMNLARRYPQLLLAVVLVDSGLMPYPEKLVADRIAGMKTPRYREVAEEMVRTTQFNAESPPELIEEVALGMAGGHQPSMTSSMFHATSPAAQEAGPIPVPALYLRSDVQPGSAEQLLERHPTLEIEQIHAAHFMQLERPDEFNAALERFIARQMSAVAGEQASGG